MRHRLILAGHRQESIKPATCSADHFLTIVRDSQGMLSIKHSRITLGGSTAMAPLAVRGLAELVDRPEGLEISVRGEGSWHGVADVLNGSIDAAFTDVQFDDSARDAISYPIAAFSIAFIAHPQSGVRALTRAQLGRVLLGRASNWSQLGGSDLPIVLVNRDTSSGVRSIVEQKVLCNQSVARAKTAGCNRSAALAVQRVPGAIAYVALPAARGLDVTLLSIDGVGPQNESVLRGAYDLWTCGYVLAHRAMHPRIAQLLDHFDRQSDLYETLGYIRLNGMSILPNLEREAAFG